MRGLFEVLPQTVPESRALQGLLADWCHAADGSPQRLLALFLRAGQHDARSARNPLL
jgi:hypothetical protein